jgi:hypothetical protein
MFADFIQQRFWASFMSKFDDIEECVDRFTEWHVESILLAWDVCHSRRRVLVLLI